MGIVFVVVVVIVIIFIDIYALTKVPRVLEASNRS